LATHYVVIHLDRVVSTQDEARNRFSGVPSLITASGQDAGRGRSGAEWMNAPRALAASLAFVPDWPPARIPLLTLVAGLAARHALGPNHGLKWPNDVVSPAGDKVAGLLAERVDDLLVIGLGVNLYWPNPPAGVTALMSADPGPDAGPAIAVDWADGLLAAVAAGPDEWGAAEYRNCSATLGHTVTWENGGPAVAVDVDDAGGLVVESGGIRHVLHSGRVRSVRPTTLTD
jgi:BirA family biotin operon repressor/biotin-[acetyl-CoA-carboxylase] ligase